MTAYDPANTNHPHFDMPSAEQASDKYRHRLPAGECGYCDKYGDEPMMPSHDASMGCESGKRPHCTCDLCY